MKKSKINESKNPFKIGDLVRLRPDVLNSAGPNQQWRKTLKTLLGKTGKVTNVFPDSRHINIKYDQSWTTNHSGHNYTVDTIGIDYTKVIPGQSRELQEVNYTQTTSGKPTISVGSPNSIARFAVENPELLKQMRDWVKDCQWGDVYDESDVDELSDIEILKGVDQHYDGGIKQFIQDGQPNQTSEGVGWGTTKDIAKDPKHTENKTTGKDQRWTIKFGSTKDLKKHGKTESISINEIKKIVKSILTEMWTGWEENKNEGKIVKFKKVYGPTSKKSKENPLDDDKYNKWLFGNESILRNIYDSFLKKTNLESIDLPFEKFAYSIYQQHLSGLNESQENKHPGMEFIIVAKSGPVATYYVSSPTQGERMVQNALSMATRFKNEEEVRKKLEQLKSTYKGITDWNIKGVASDVLQPNINQQKPSAGHQVFKPVRNSLGEYVVRWAYNGKTLSAYSYYTDDKKDALDTYELMFRNAQEMNRKGEPPYESNDNDD